MAEDDKVAAFRTELADLRRETDELRAVNRAIYAALIELGHLPLDVVERFGGGTLSRSDPAEAKKALSDRAAKLDAAIGNLYRLLWDENGQPR